MADPHKFSAFRPFARLPERAFAASKIAPDPRTALIFLDTNVLLTPYRGSRETLAAIKNTYANLRSHDRLVVPAQVAREFARLRPRLVADLHKQLRDARSLAVNGRFEPPLILHDISDYKDARKGLEAAHKALKRYRDSVEKLIQTIEKWESTDPILEVYQSVFDQNVVRELSIPATELETLRKARFDAKIPPGFRDKDKDDGGVGDLLIWFTILATSQERARDALFVSEDVKDDWYHRSGDEPLFPRYELREEFSEYTGGHAFGLLSLSNLLNSFGVADKVVKEVRDRERFNPSAFWQRHLSQLETFAINDILRRIRTANPEATTVIAQGYPDVVVEIPSERIAIEIATFGDAAAAEGNAHSRIIDRLTRANNVRFSGSYTEIVLVLAVAHQGVAVQIAAWFKESRFERTFISIVVAHVDSAGLHVVLLETTNALVSAAFDPGRLPNSA